MGLPDCPRRLSRRTESPKPGVSHNCKASPCGVASKVCDSANTVTWAASRTSPISTPTRVRANVVLPLFVCEISAN